MVGFFEESENNRSMNRLQVFMYTCFGMVFSLLVYFVSKDWTAGLTIFLSISGVASGAKIAQKAFEKKEGKQSIPTDTNAVG